MDFFNMNSFIAGFNFMKKSFMKSSCIVLICLCIFVGCNHGENSLEPKQIFHSKAGVSNVEDDQQKDEITNETDRRNNIKLATILEKLTYNSTTYRCDTVEYNVDKECWVRYPQIKLLGNLDSQNKINQYIEEYAMNFLVPEEQAIKNCTLEYSITLQSNEYLSVHFTGVKFYHGAVIAHRLENALNFDLNTGELFDVVLKVSDQQLMKLLSESFLLSKYKNEQYKEPDNTLTMSLLYADSLTFYLTKEKLGIIYNLTISNDFYSVEIPYKEINQLGVC